MFQKKKKIFFLVSLDERMTAAAESDEEAAAAVSSSEKAMMTAIRRDYNQLKRDTSAKINKKLDEMMKQGFLKTKPDVSRQVISLAAAKMALKYPDYCKFIVEFTGVKRESFYRSKRRISSEENKDKQLVDLIVPGGRPRRYPSAVDDDFLNWMKDKGIDPQEKTSEGMRKKYLKLFRAAQLKSEPQSSKRARIQMNHVYRLIKAAGFKMTSPTVDTCDLCVSFKTLFDWFHNPEIQEALKDVDPVLLFAAGEVVARWRRRAPRKVAAMGGSGSPMIKRSTCGNVVSLFTIVSAAQELVQPVALLHGNGDEYKSSKPQIRCYQTSNGSLDETAFSNIMRTIFIPHVQRLREDQNLVKKRRAVLVLSGSQAIYYLPALRTLKKSNITVVVIPEYSSQLVLPLELGIHQAIKNVIPFELRRLAPSVKNEAVKRPKSEDGDEDQPSKRTRKEEESKDGDDDDDDDDEKEEEEEGEKEETCDHADDESVTDLDEEVKDEENADEDEAAKKTDVRVGAVAFKREKLVEALINSVHVATFPFNLKLAWEASHLFPFDENPPFSEADEQKLRQEKGPGAIATEAGKPKFKGDPTHITGVITSPRTMKQLEKILSE